MQDFVADAYRDFLTGKIQLRLQEFREQRRKRIEKYRKQMDCSHEYNRGDRCALCGLNLFDPIPSDYFSLF